MNIEGKKHWSYDMIKMTRGIAIVLVCLHHALSQCSNRGIIGQFVYRNIYYVHVVLFFVVSGYLYESKKEKYYSSNLCFIQSKFMRLMVPYLSWQLIIFLFVNIGLSIPVLHNTFVGLGFQHWTFGEFVHNTLFFTNSYVELLWFLYVLFIVFVRVIIAVWAITIEPVIDTVRMRILFLTISGLSVGAISTDHPCQLSTQNTANAAASQ